MASAGTAAEPACRSMLLAHIRSLDFGANSEGRHQVAQLPEKPKFRSFGLRLGFVKSQPPLILERSRPFHISQRGLALGITREKHGKILMRKIELLASEIEAFFRALHVLITSPGIGRNLVARLVDLNPQFGHIERGLRLLAARVRPNE